MVIVRAAFNQHWYGNYYRGPDGDTPGDIMPANDKQAERLTASGQAYYDFVDKKPTMSNTKKDIEKYLEVHGIPYSEYATKKELLELIDDSDID